jgi:hypothetical protein
MDSNRKPYWQRRKILVALTIVTTAVGDAHVFDHHYKSPWSQVLKPALSLLSFFIVTAGVGDIVMRLWASQSRNCGSVQGKGPPAFH